MSIYFADRGSAEACQAHHALRHALSIRSHVPGPGQETAFSTRPRTPVTRGCPANIKRGVWGTASPQGREGVGRVLWAAPLKTKRGVWGGGLRTDQNPVRNCPGLQLGKILDRILIRSHQPSGQSLPKIGPGSPARGPEALLNSFKHHKVHRL